MLTSDQERRLTGGGDCHDHFHSIDRVRVYSDIAALQKLEVVRTPPTGSYTVGAADDFIEADNYGPYQLPKAKDGRIVEIVMKTDTPVRINMFSGDTFYGETSILLEEKTTAIRLKAVTGGWIGI
jgi:hypothetical protein